MEGMYMSILFTSFFLRSLELKNRFVFSACEDNLGSPDGFVTDAVIRKNKRLAQGEVGLIVSSHLFIHPWGRTRECQLGIHNDQTISGLNRLAKAVHGASGKIVFQLGHAGLGTKREAIGRSPLGPSGEESEMDEESILETIRNFAVAAERAVTAGADGIQLHAAHGYLLNEFLSPFFNRRRDAWGGTEENRFRLLREVVVAVRKVIPATMPLLVKLNTHDHTPEEGITPPLAVSYARRLAGLAIDGLEVSCGTSAHSPWQMCRGDVPVEEILQGIPEPKRARVAETLSRIRGNFKLVEGYNRDKAVMIRPVMDGIPLFAVGGWRSVPAMEAALEQKDVDLISLCRPFIREPALVRKIRERKTAAVSCIHCNRCLIALANQLPVRCYYKGLPVNR